MKKLLFAAALAAVASVSMNAQSDNMIRKLLIAETAIESLYVDEVTDTALVEAAVKGMLSKLDPHSTYLLPSEVTSSNETLQGIFEGIGVQFNMVEDTLFVVQPVSGGPSEKVGIMAGDRIIAANDTVIAGVKMAQETIMKHLRGPKGTHVKLEVIRHGVKGSVFFDVVRDKIPLNTIDAYYMAAPGVGYIKIASFGATTVDEFKDAMASLKAQGAVSLILDLQGNGGGYLNAAVGIGDQFLERDRMVVFTEGRRTPRVAYMAEGKGCFRDGRLVVLIDEYSASASEIVSGAVQDWDRGTLIGRRSFGKGLVQRGIDLPDGSLIRLTVAQYYTPSGRCIQKPYGDSIDYRRDIVDRLHRGELTNADSIHFADSLRYETLIQGRTVYAGGGIMPDIFVPMDTTTTTPWYREASAKGAILQGSFSYIDANRKKLLRKYRTFSDFEAGYTVGDDLMSEILAKADALKVEFKEDEYKECLPYLTVHLKALVARNLWGMSEYYHILNMLNPVYIKALDYICE